VTAFKFTNAAGTSRHGRFRIRPEKGSEYLSDKEAAAKSENFLFDEIGHRLGAALVCVLIGERPGLTSPDSLGAYLTWQPALGRTDSERNCLSNIRPAGMPYEEAAQRLVYLCTQARLRRCTGVMLKDETPSPSLRLQDNGPG